MRFLLTLFATLVALACFPLALQAEELTAEQILTRVDAKVNGHTDQEMDVRMTVIDTDGSEKVYHFNVKQKGDEKRLIRFTSGEIKGMSILVEDARRVYVYLPGYKKVRRVASHNMNQSFVGSDYSNTDMASVAYTRLYDAVIDHEDADFWYLKLTPKDKDSAYAYLLFQVGKKDFLQWGTKYYNAKGEFIKEFKASKPKAFPGVKDEWHSFIEMSDPRTGHKTTLEVLGLKLNQGLKDRIFTTRQLRWSR